MTIDPGVVTILGAGITAVSAAVLAVIKNNGNLSIKKFDSQAELNKYWQGEITKKEAEIQRLNDVATAALVEKGRVAEQLKACQDDSVELKARLDTTKSVAVTGGASVKSTIDDKIEEIKKI